MAQARHCPPTSGSGGSAAAQAAAVPTPFGETAVSTDQTVGLTVPGFTTNSDQGLLSALQYPPPSGIQNDRSEHVYF